MFSEIEQKIISDLRYWSKYALEIPNEHYNNLELKSDFIL